VGRDRVFGREDNEITLLGRAGDVVSVDGPHAGSKDVLAHRILDASVAVRRRG
jgi:phosphopantothenoylcysteine decarboxylase/phosphopantothenate--cysteine ligase